MSDGPLTSNESASRQEGPINVLIMNLPFRVRWQDLKDLCRQACPIERADVALEVDGRSRGFGEVTCSSFSDAQKLFNMFDGYEWQNRRLSVIVMSGATQDSNALPIAAVQYRDSPQNLRLPTSSIQPIVPTDEKLLFVGNLPFSMQWQDLKDLLRPAGRVQRTDISMSSNGRSRGWGTALFYTAEEAQNAVDMFNDTEVDGRRIKVRLDRLGGRGQPGYGSAIAPRFGGGNYLSTTAMQQQPPSSYPLQQNRGVSHNSAGPFMMAPIWSGQTNSYESSSVPADQPFDQGFRVNPTSDDLHHGQNQSREYRQGRQQ